MFSPDTLVWAEKLLYRLYLPQTLSLSSITPYAPPPCVRVQRELPAVPMFRDVPQTTPLPSSIPPTPTVCQPRHRLAHLTPRDTTPLLKFPFESHLAHTPLSLSLRSFPVPRACRCSPHTRHHTRVHPFACADSRSSRNLVRHPSLSRPRPSLPHTLDPFIHPFESPSHPSHPARPTVHIRAPTRTHMQWCPCVWSRLFPSPTLRLLCALRLPNFTAKSLQVLVRKFTSLWQPHAHATLTAPRLRRGGGTPRAAEEVRAGASCRSRRPARTERARADSEDGWRPPRRQSPLSRRRATHGP